MFGRIENSLKNVQQCHEIYIYQRRRVEPQTGKDRAAQGTVLSRQEWLVPRFAEDEPVDLPLGDAPDDVFADTVSLVSLELVVQVVAGAAGCDMIPASSAPRDRLGGSFDITRFDPAGT